MAVAERLPLTDSTPYLLHARDFGILIREQQAEINALARRVVDLEAQLEQTTAQLATARHELKHRRGTSTRSALAAVERTSDPREPTRPIEGCLRLGRLVLDYDRRRVTVDDVVVPLARREFELLGYMAREPGRPWSSLELQVGVWGARSTSAGDSRVNNFRSSWQRLREAFARVGVDHRPFFEREAVGPQARAYVVKAAP